MNITVCSATRTTPYELVFGTACRHDCTPITDPLYLQVLMNQLSDVDSAARQLTAADELTRLAAAVEVQQRSAATAAASVAPADVYNDQTRSGGSESTTRSQSQARSRQSETGRSGVRSVTGEVVRDNTDIREAMELSVDSSLSPQMLAITKDDQLTDLAVGSSGAFGRYATLLLNVAGAVFERVAPLDKDDAASPVTIWPSPTTAVTRTAPATASPLTLW
jgi:hypothetical protein